MSFEESLVWHASPTLASIKVANLYSYKFRTEEECLNTINSFNNIMNPKGIYIELMKNAGDFYLIYVYRKSHLRSALGDICIQEFLETYGYSSAADLQGYLGLLKKKLREDKDFPHEVGVFLGYPLDDVRAFIESNGRECTVCGDWKAYHDEENARCTFCKYKHCKDVYIRVYREGRKFGDMLVSA